MQAFDALRTVFVRVEADVDELVKKAEWLSMHGNNPKIEDYGCRPGTAERQVLIVQTAFRGAQTAFMCATLAAEIVRDIMDYAVALSLFGEQGRKLTPNTYTTGVKDCLSSNSVFSAAIFDKLRKRVKATMEATTTATEALVGVQKINREKKYNTIILCLKVIVQRLLEPMPGRVQMLHESPASGPWQPEISTQESNVSAVATAVVKVVNEVQVASLIIFLAEFALTMASELRVDLEKSLAEFFYSSSDQNKNSFTANLDNMSTQTPHEVRVRNINGTAAGLQTLALAGIS